MLDILRFSFHAVAPILCLVLVGKVAVWAGLVDIPALKKINKFNFRVCFAALMFTNLYAMEGLGNFPLGLFGSLLVILSLLVFIGWLGAHFATDRRDRKAVLMQASFRSNYAIIGLVLAETLGGQDGLALATLCQLPCVLFFNIAAVICFSVYADNGKRVNAGKVAKEIATNPLVVGIVLGVLTLAV
ncbi:MAG: AEC family transporter, partial [bacterium]